MKTVTGKKDVPIINLEEVEGKLKLKMCMCRCVCGL